MKNKRILIIDDELFVRKVVARSLEMEGFFVNTASNGKDGFNKIDTFKPDLVLTDLKMPQMSGLELCVKLKDKGIPVVVLSAHVTKSIVQKLGMLKFNSILTKPFDLERLLETINNLLEKSEKDEKNEEE